MKKSLRTKTIFSFIDFEAGNRTARALSCFFMVKEAEQIDILSTSLVRHEKGRWCDLAQKIPFLEEIDPHPLEEYYAYLFQSVLRHLSTLVPI